MFFHSLYSNHITSLPSGVFSSLNSLSSLFILLINIHFYLFIICLYFISLSLSSNKIESLPPSLFNKLSFLTSLYIFIWRHFTCSLTFYSESSILSFLIISDLGSNSLKSLESNTFSNLRNLNYFYASSFHYHTHHIISLSYNSFTTLPSNIFTYNNALISLF